MIRLRGRGPDTAVHGVSITSQGRTRVRVRSLLAAGAALLVGLAVVAGTLGLGVAHTMTGSFAPRAAAARPTGAPIRAATDRIQVAVALGVGGSVVTDALAPYGIFARSDDYDAFTVSAGRARVGLSGGLSVIPDFSLADVGSGRAPAADIVVVPAFADPASPENEGIRAWIRRAHDDGATVLGVCAGARVLVAAGLLDGRTATSHFADLDDLEANAPETTWVRGLRYVDDGRITTTAGVTSGIAGAIHLVERFSGRAEAARIAEDVGAADWGDPDSASMPVHRPSLEDYPYTLGTALPWFRPTWAVALTPQTDEIDAAAAFEVYSGTSSAASLVPVATGSTVRTKHGMTVAAALPRQLSGRVDRLVVPGPAGPATERLIDWGRSSGIATFIPQRRNGESSFGPLVRDLARVSDAPTAATLAKYIEFPAGPLRDGAPLPSRVLLLLAGTVLLGASTGAGTWLLLSRAAITRRARRLTRRPTSDEDARPARAGGRRVSPPAPGRGWTA